MAAIIHDYMWRERAAAGEMDWVDADGVFRRAMRELGVPFLRRWIMWAAVRWGALIKPRGRKGWLREGWRVILFTLVASPFVLPPAVLILLAMLGFYLLELLIWIPIQITATLQTRLIEGKPRKEVILPKLELTTTGSPPTVTVPASTRSSPEG